MAKKDRFEIEERNLLWTLMSLAMLTAAFAGFGIAMTSDIVDLVADMKSVASAETIKLWKLVAGVPGGVAGLATGFLCMRHLLSADAELGLSTIMDSLARSPLVGRYVARARMRTAVRHASRGSSAARR